MSELKESAVAERGGTLTLAPAPALPSAIARLGSRPVSSHSALRRSFDKSLYERRVFLLVPFAMIWGIVGALLTPAAPEPAVLATVGAVLALALFLSRNSAPAARLAFLGGAFWVGFSLLTVHAALFGTTMLARAAYGNFEMRVDEIITHDAAEVRAIVSNITPLAGAKPLPIRRARVVLKRIPEIGPGDRISGPVRFYPIPGPVVPNGFDTQFHAFFDGIGAYGNSTGGVQHISSEEQPTAERVVDGLRRGIADRIDRALPQPSAGIARALITGDQSAVSDAARDTMAQAGLAHVLSVSGLHLTLVAALVMAVLRGGLALLGWFDRYVSTKRVAAAGAIVAALGYYAISGGNVAALRSTIMIVLVLGAVVLGRRALTMRNVAIAAVSIILIDPASVLRPSFQLSFAAVVALIGAWEMMRPAGREKTALWKVLGYLWGIVLTSVVAGLATVLFSIYHFQQTSPLGVLGNLFSLPLVGFVMMPAALAATLLMPFGLEGSLLSAMGWSIDRMLDLAGIVAAWSTGLSASPLLTPLSLLLGLVALAWFAFFTTWHRYIAPLLLVPGVAVLAMDQPPDVLIADTTQAVAIRGEAGLGLVSGKPDSFAVEVWADTYGEKLVPYEMLRCDQIGCFGKSPKGFAVATVRSSAAFYEDCGMADLVIARIPAPASCHAGTVIDADDLQRGGTHWLRWNDVTGRFEIRTAVPPLDRPWRVWAR